MVTGLQSVRKMNFLHLIIYLMCADYLSSRTLGDLSRENPTSPTNGTFRQFLDTIKSCAPPDKYNMSYINNMVASFLKTSGAESSWLPVKRQDLDGWRWLNGEYYGATLSRVSKPGMDCAVLRAADQVFDNVWCNRVYPRYLCQKKVGAACQTKSPCYVYNHTRYQIYTEYITWYEARTRCTERGEQLAVIGKDYQQELLLYLSKNITSKYTVLIGLRKSDYFLYPHNSSADVYFWHARSPCPCESSDECVSMRKSSDNTFLWRTTSCNATIPIFCYYQHTNEGTISSNPDQITRQPVSGFEKNVTEPTPCKADHICNNSWNIVLIVVSVLVISTLLGFNLLCFFKQRNRRPVIQKRVPGSEENEHEERIPLHKEKTAEEEKKAEIQHKRQLSEPNSTMTSSGDQSSHLGKLFEPAEKALDVSKEREKQPVSFQHDNADSKQSGENNTSNMNPERQELAELRIILGETLWPQAQDGFSLNNNEVREKLEELKNKVFNSEAEIIRLEKSLEQAKNDPAKPKKENKESMTSQYNSATPKPDGDNITSKMQDEQELAEIRNIVTKALWPQAHVEISKGNEEIREKLGELIKDLEDLNNDKMRLEKSLAEAEEYVTQLIDREKQKLNLQSKNTKLQQEKQSLENENSVNKQKDKQRLLQNNQSENNDSSKIGDLGAVLEALNNKIKGLKGINEQLGKLLKQKRDENAILSSRLQNEKTEQELNLNLVAAERQSLEKDLTEIKKILSQILGLKLINSNDYNEEVRKALDMLINELSITKSENKNFKEMQIKEKKLVSELKNENVTLKEELQANSSQIEHFKQQLTKMATQFRIEMEKAESMKQHILHTPEQGNTVVETETVGKLTAMVSELQHMVNSQKEDIARLHQELAKAQKEASQQRQFAEQAELSTEVELLNDQISTLKIKLEEANSSREKFSKGYKAIWTRLQEAEASIKSNENVIKQEKLKYEELERKHNELVEENKGLKEVTTKLKESAIKSEQKASRAQREANQYKREADQDR